MPDLKINHRNIYYELHGSGELMVLLHHGFGSLAMFKDVYPSLVEAGFQVLMYDRRGYGKSEPGDAYRDFYVSDSFRSGMVDEFVAVLDSLELGPAHLVGQCEGGVTSVDFAVAHPQRVKSLVLGSMQTWSLTDVITFNRESFCLSFGELSPELQTKFITWHGQGWAKEFYEMAADQGGAYGTSFFDIRPQLAKVQCPSLVIYPDRSALFDVEQAVAQYRVLKQGELAVMPYCGHNTYEYRPQDYIAQILAFHQRMAERPARGGPKDDRPDPTQMTCAG